MFWWFERQGRHMRLEVLQLATGEYELRLIQPDGAEQVELFLDSRELARRQQALQRTLVTEGWTGPHGWLL
jgi:hypothetical protein